MTTINPEIATPEQAERPLGSRADLTTVAACVLVYLFTRQGLVNSYPELQMVLLSGLTLGSLTERRSTVAISAVALGLAALLMPPAFIAYGFAGTTKGVQFAFSLAVGGSLIGLLILWAKRNVYAGLNTAAAVLALIVVFGNMATTAAFSRANIPQASFPTVNEFLMEAPVAGQYEDDTRTYLRTYYDMAAGRGYYVSFRDAVRGQAQWGKDPLGPLAYRMPTVFWAWQLQPWGPLGIPGLLLVLDIIALGVLAFALTRYIPPGAAVVGVTGLAAYLLYFASTVVVVWIEPWALPFMLVSIAAAMLAERSVSHQRGWWWASAGFALLAMLTREHAVFLASAGLATSLAVPRLRRKRIWIPWAVAIATFLVAWAVHASAANAVSQAQSFTWEQFARQWLHGGVDNLRASVSYGNAFLTRGSVGPVALALLGVLGLVFAPRAIRLLLGLAAAQGFFLLLFSGSTTSNVYGTRVGYWGVFLLTYLLVALPFVFRPLSGAATPGGPES